ncbi:Conotoxin TxMMSK-05 [Varanus komodoensis]|nr:Conotoxin TxMMSK-05 [Varanus komodoensis]
MHDLNLTEASQLCSPTTGVLEDTQTQKKLEAQIAIGWASAPVLSTLDGDHHHHRESEEVEGERRKHHHRERESERRASKADFLLCSMRKGKSRHHFLTAKRMHWKEMLQVYSLLIQICTLSDDWPDPIAIYSYVTSKMSRLIPRLDESEVRIKIGGKNINNLRYADDTTLRAESEEELKSLLIRVKMESTKVGLTQH